MSSRRSPIYRDVRAGLAALVLGLVGGTSALPLAAAADEAAFDRAVRQLASGCARGPATACAERSFALVDADDNGVADRAELEAVEARLRRWTAAHADELQPLDLRALQLGFVLVDTIGIDRGMLLYDDDGDGALSLEEMTADFNLDGRPLPELVQSRELVDWPSLRRRFGTTAMIFDYLDSR